jgi:hypothetical protein
MHYEVEVLIRHPLDDKTRRFLEAVQTSANRLVRFRGDDESVRLTIDAVGLSREDAIRAGAGEVARIFPGSNDEKYIELRHTPIRRNEDP